jgi:HD-like signal output (HDOD) protein
MLAWLQSLKRPAPVPASAPDPAAVAPQAPSALSGLLAVPAPQPGPLTASERAWIAPLERLLAAETLPGDLLPRAPSVIPQLMGLLRQAQPARGAMVLQVQKDPLLTAEVLRVARSPFYGGAAIETLDEALDRIGTSGLQSAMARLLLRPVFDAQSGGLLAQAAPRLWQHSDCKAMLCAEHVARAGGERFEGYLAGLLHDTGWLALLRLLDRAALRPAWPISLALDAALERRKDRLFGRITADWGLSPGLSALAQHLRDPHAADAAAGETGVLLAALRAADREATEAMARAPS